MDNILEDYLKTAEPAIDEDFVKGKQVSFAQFEELEDDFKAFIPQWVTYMLLKYPVAGLLLRFTSIESKVKAIRFYDFDDMSDNYYQLSPGKHIAPYGYLCIGENPGDDTFSYYIKIDEGENPPVYQIVEGTSIEPKVILTKSTVKVADKLSDIFKEVV